MISRANPYETDDRLMVLLEVNYLLQLEKLHDEWLLDGGDSRVVVLDGGRRWSTPEILAEIGAVA